MSVDSEHLIVLGPNLLVDLEGGLVIRADIQTLLTAREVRLLRLLDHARHTSRSFLSAEALVPVLGSTQAFDPEHCVQQLISEIRKKLGELPGHPLILRGRRGFGYRLYPALQDSASDPEVDISPLSPDGFGLLQPPLQQNHVSTAVYTYSATGSITQSSDA